ncbi:MAG TPA: hypothetical protein VHA07_05865 [Devosia sp.]|nr:hypothetical protein [Devosia sp.]
MRVWTIAADRASLGVTETGAHLDNVTFSLAGGLTLKPMHTSPWEHEQLPPDLDPILRVLRGDFFCAPFGASDVLPSERRAHGLPANGTWRLARQTDTVLELALEGDVMGARVDGRYEVKPGHAVVYQRHIVSGGSGRIPMAHHAMLRAEPPLQLAFGPHVWAGTPEGIPETPPNGRSILSYPQQIADLHRARLADGGTADLTIYPFAEDHEDLWMIATDGKASFGWTAATSPEGWVWFALKDPRVLPGTVLWLSNGGRSYAPWSSRHRHVIGIEEVRSYFASGHAASIADNPLSRRGIATAFELKPNGRIVVNYLFGVAAAPAGFGTVVDITPDGEGIRITGRNGLHIHAAVDLSHLSAT